MNVLLVSRPRLGEENNDNEQLIVHACSQNNIQDHKASSNHITQVEQDLNQIDKRIPKDKTHLTK